MTDSKQSTWQQVCPAGLSPLYLFTTVRLTAAVGDDRQPHCSRSSHDQWEPAK